jgi:hypothetical protein
VSKNCLQLGPRVVFHADGNDSEKLSMIEPAIEFLSIYSLFYRLLSIRELTSGVPMAQSVNTLNQTRTGGSEPLTVTPPSMTR